MARDCTRGAIGFDSIDQVTTYLGRQGGLWAPGSNVEPTWHRDFAELEARRIQPRNGRIGFATLGFSFGSLIHAQIQATALAEVPLLDPAVVPINLAKPGVDADDLADPGHIYWTSWLDQQLALLGFDREDIQVAWCETGRQAQTMAFPQHADSLALKVEAFAVLAKAFFPNLRLLYLTGPHSMNYLTVLGLEPYYFEQQFGIRDAIAKQASGDMALNPMPDRGPVLAPTLQWAGRGFWCDGPRARPDGHDWLCPKDPGPDGAHPSPIGALKLARLLLRDLAADPAAQLWLQRRPAKDAPPGGGGPTTSIG